MSNDLERLAQRLSNNPTFFAWSLANYAREHNLDDAALCAKLGCTQTTLLDLRLCRRPGAAESKTAAEDVERIASAFGVNLDALRQVVATTPH